MNGGWGRMMRGKGRKGGGRSVDVCVFEGKWMSEEGKGGKGREKTSVDGVSIGLRCSVSHVLWW